MMASLIRIHDLQKGYAIVAVVVNENLVNVEAALRYSSDSAGQFAPYFCSCRKYAVALFFEGVLGFVVGNVGFFERGSLHGHVQFLFKLWMKVLRVGDNLLVSKGAL